MRTSDLIGHALNRKVAELEGAICQVWGLGSCLFNGVKIDSNKEAGTYSLYVLRDPHFEEVYRTCDGWPLARSQEIWNPSSNWVQGGPIIEREGISWHCGNKTSWHAYGYGSSENFSGPTPLIAAMRCYVASKLGDEVDIPEELL